MNVWSRCMRVIIASSVLLLGVALLAALSPSAAAARTPARTAPVVCPAVTVPCCGPVTSARPDLVPCCPVPTPGGCCEPGAATTCCATAACPSALSIAVAPNPVSEGKETTISGALTGGTVASQTVTLWEEPAGQASFTDVAETQTGTTGAYTFSRPVSTNAKWYAKTGSVESATVSQSVIAAINLHPSTVHPKAGAKVMLSGTIAPSHAGERVLLQRLSGGRWVTIARPKLGAGSRFAIAEKMRGHSVASFRVVLAADARNAQSVSGTVVIRAR